MASGKRPLPPFALGVALLVGGAFLSPVVSAQDALTDDAAERRVERARTLFTDAVGLVTQQRYPEAEELFREALTLRDSPAIRYNLASVLFEQGEYPEGRALADQVLADATTPDGVREHTRALITQMDERAGHARIEVTGGEATVAVDGYAVPELSRDLPLAPGAHVASASRGEGEVAREQFEIATGEHRVVSLDVSAPEAQEPEPIVEVPAGPAPLEEQWWFWTAIGGGVVVVAVVIGVVAATSGGVEDPVQGNFEPGVLRW